MTNKDSDAVYWNKDYEKTEIYITLIHILRDLCVIIFKQRVVNNGIIWNKLFIYYAAR